MRRALTSAALAALPLLLCASAEVVSGTAFRAVTLEPGERRTFRIPELNKVTAASGRCVEEGLDEEEPETLFITASCSGVRTVLAWRQDGSRVHVMACAEDEKRPAALVTLRKTVQAELKGSKMATACVRNGRVELWGWVRTNDELRAIAKLESKYGLDRVRTFVELAEHD